MKTNQGNFNVVLAMLTIWTIVSGSFLFFNDPKPCIILTTLIAFFGTFPLMAFIELIFRRSSTRFLGHDRSLPWWFAITLFAFAGMCLWGSINFLREGWRTDETAANLPCLVLSSSWLFTTVVMYLIRWRGYYVTSRPDFIAGPPPGAAQKVS